MEKGSEKVGGDIIKGHQVTFGGDNMFIIIIVMMALWVCTYVKIHQTVQFKYVQFLGYPLCLNKTVKNKQINMYTHTYTHSPDNVAFYSYTFIHEI